jgi:dihydroxyacetone kinase
MSWFEVTISGDKKRQLAFPVGRLDGSENADIFPVCDDVSVARLKGALVGRRALVGTILGMTIFHSAQHRSEFFCLFSSFQKYRQCFRSRLVFRHCPFDTVLKVGQAVTGVIASIACTVGHCQVPGRSEYSVTPQNSRNWPRPSQRTCQ